VNSTRIVATLLAAVATLTGCGGSEQEKLRTVKSFDFASCCVISRHDLRMLGILARTASLKFAV